MNKILAAGAIALLLLSSACTGAVTSIVKSMQTPSIAVCDKIHSGQTTAEQMHVLFGDPVRVVSNTHDKAAPDFVETRTWRKGNLMIDAHFDAKGIVGNYTCGIQQ